MINMSYHKVFFLKQLDGVVISIRKQYQVVASLGSHYDKLELELRSPQKIEIPKK